MINQTLSEATDLHPRVAHWLTQQGLVYIHEYRTGAGDADFVVIDPTNGHITVIECKIDIGAMIAYYAAGQVTSYHNSLGVPDASKWVISFTDLPNWREEEYKEKDVQCWTVSMDMPKESYPPKAKQIENFTKVYLRFYGDTPLDGLYPNAEKPEHFSFSLRPHDPIEKKILQAIKEKMEEHRKTRSSANIKTVLLEWFADYLDLE